MAFLTRLGAVCILFAGAAHAQQYFPHAVFAVNPRSDQFTIDLYSRFLKALGEPSLWELSHADHTAEVYRFLWLRNRQYPVSVRIVVHAKGRGHGRARLFAKVVIERRLNRRRCNLMDGSERKLLERIDDVGFWTQPLHGPEKAGEPDGSNWIIEGIKGGEYHVIDRWNPKPTDGDAAYILGSMMVFDLARLRIKQSEIY